MDEHHKINLFEDSKAKKAQDWGKHFSFFECCYLKAAETDNRWLALDKRYLISIEAGAV